MAGNVKLKDIAEKVGVSVVTVSNALSGKKGVSDSVREMIIATAQEMGYDSAKYNRQDMEALKIGVIVAEEYLEVGASFYWTMYQQVVYTASQKNCFTVFEILERSFGSRKGLPKLLMQGTVDGLIILGKMEHGYVERILDAAEVPVVLLDFYDRAFSCDAVMSNNYLGMYKATKYLQEKGHRNIGFVGSVDATDNIMDRYFGFRKGMEKQGLEIREDWVLEDRDLLTGEIRVILPERLPSAFVCSSDLAAGGLYDSLMKAGYRVPEEVSIIGYDNFLFGHPFANSLTTYNVDMERMAKAAIHILLKKIRKKGKHQGVRYVDGEIIERSSVAYCRH